jgi:hypothetical protein
MVGEFHAQLTLDNGETVRVIFPESLAMPNDTTNTSLLNDTQFLMASHSYISDLKAPRLKFETGGEYTMNVVEAHKILPLLPFSVLPPTNHRIIIMHKPTPYDPPSFFNHLTTRRPDISTPTAMVWHARLACACKEVMQRTQRNSTGMQVRKDSWDQLDHLLPCSSCIAGKMRKTERALPHSYTDLKALTSKLLREENPSRHFGFAVSRTAATNAQINMRNKEVSIDWAIVNKQNLPDAFNVFAVFYDMHIGLVHVEFQASRGQADEALNGYLQRYGIPEIIVHDNAREFTDGNFAKICKERGITQRRSAPYTPNQNPAEKYMDVLVSGARSLLYTSGLNANPFWPHAVEHRTYLQNQMALPG